MVSNVYDGYGNCFLFVLCFPLDVLWFIDDGDPNKLGNLGKCDEHPCIRQYSME